MSGRGRRTLHLPCFASGVPQRGHDAFVAADHSFIRPTWEALVVKAYFNVELSVLVKLFLFHMQRRDAMSEEYKRSMFRRSHFLDLQFHQP